MNLTIKAREYTNIYEKLAITVGTQITVSNNGSHDVRLYSDENEPTALSSYLLLRPFPFTAKNNSADLGAWALCTSDIVLDIKKEA